MIMRREGQRERGRVETAVYLAFFSDNKKLKLRQCQNPLDTKRLPKIKKLVRIEI